MKCVARASCAPVTPRPERIRAGWSGTILALLCGNGSTMRRCPRFASWRCRSDPGALHSERPRNGPFFRAQLDSVPLIALSIRAALLAAYEEDFAGRPRRRRAVPIRSSQRVLAWLDAHPSRLAGVRCVVPVLAQFGGRGWGRIGDSRCLFENTNPRFTGALRADDGTRTHDLLHGNQKRAIRGRQPRRLLWCARKPRDPRQRQATT
jgi:hypothetical protein